jgi:hypothetical protein
MSEKYQIFLDPPSLKKGGIRALKCPNLSGDLGGSPRVRCIQKNFSDILSQQTLLHDARYRLTFEAVTKFTVV